MKPKKKVDQSKLRTRYDPPTVDEAVFAAQGLTGETEAQVQIAAHLIGLPEDEVRGAVLRARSPVSRIIVRTARQQTVVVERRNHRTVFSR